MSALTVTEEGSIETFVDGLVAAGLYNDITEIYAPCFNATDYLTGFKFMTLVNSEQVPVHTAGEYVEFQNNNQHLLDPQNMDTFSTLDGFMGCYNVFTDVDTTNNSDLFGVEDASQICYYRWRGDDTDDFNAQYNVTDLIPRTTSSVRPNIDFVGFGLGGTDQIELVVGGSVVRATRVRNATVPKVDCQWHGHNVNGVPAAGNMSNSRYSFMIHANGLWSDGDIVSLRALVLQFLRDIGVTGIPVT